MGLLTQAVRSLRSVPRTASRHAVALATTRSALPQKMRGFSDFSTGHNCEPYISPVNGAPRIYSPWNKWFPYEPVPCSPKLGPYIVKVKSMQEYYWCACGECVNQPWCDDNGGPDGCASRGFHAVKIVPTHSGSLWLCGSKHTGTRPYFNGTCWLVWIDCNPVEAAAIGFVGSFFFGIFLTWMIHP